MVDLIVLCRIMVRFVCLHTYVIDFVHQTSANYYRHLVLQLLSTAVWHSDKFCS